MRFPYFLEFIYARILPVPLATLCYTMLSMSINCVLLLAHLDIDRYLLLILEQLQLHTCSTMAAAPCTVIPGGNGRGRVTVATRLLAPGEVVLTEHAVACVATAGRPLCDDCLTPVTENDRQVICGLHGNHCFDLRGAYLPDVPLGLSVSCLAYGIRVAILGASTFPS